MQPIDSSFSRGIAAAAFAYGRADRLSGGRVRKRGADERACDSLT